MSQSRTKSTLVNTSFAILSRIVSMIFGFIQKTIFIRTLGISYAGVSGLFTDILTVLSLAELGIGSAIAYSLYKPIAENDYRRIAQLMNFFKKAYHFIAAIVFVVGVCLIPLIPYIVKDVPDITENIQLIFSLYICNTAATYLLIYKNTLLVADQKQYIVSNIQMIFTMASIAVQCVTLLIFKNFLVYLAFQIIFSLLQNVTINYVATKRYPELEQYANETIPKEDRKKLFRDVKALMMYKIANVITTGTDSTIISTALGTSQVGILGNYRTIRGYITSMIAQFYNSINPSLGNLAATEGKERQYAIFQKLNFGTFWLASFCTTCFFSLFNPFMRIWLGREEWILPLGTVWVYCSEYFFSTMIGPVGAFRQANGLFVQTKYLALMQALLNLGISVILVKPLGILGVLLGTVLSCLLTQMWYEPMVIYRSVFKRNVITYYIKLLFYYSITIMNCLIVMGIMRFVQTTNLWVILLIRIGLCLLVPNIVISVLFGRMTEYKECVSLLKKIIETVARKLIRKRGGSHES